MPQVLILIAAAGAGLVALRRWYKDEQRRIAAELAKAREAMERREREDVVPLERDPNTGVYRPKARLH
jgi:hypothetical protein